MGVCIDHGKRGSGLGYARNGQDYPLHRWVFCQTYNLEPEDIKGICVCHSCNNPRCINPDHMYLGKTWKAFMGLK